MEYNLPAEQREELDVWLIFFFCLVILSSPLLPVCWFCCFHASFFFPLLTLLSQLSLLVSLVRSALVALRRLGPL